MPAKMTDVAATLYARLRGQPLIDAHTHLVAGRLGARGLHDILLYHMAVSELYAAGCPTGTRLTEYPGVPSTEEAHARIAEAVPFLPHVRATGISWGIRIILGELYDWHEPVTEKNWPELDDRIRERADDATWHRAILERAGIQHTFTEWARRETDRDDDILSFALEWGFFTRCQWGEHDTALYELERCWGQRPGPPAPIGASGRAATERTVATVDDVHAALEWYVDALPVDRICSIATHISTDIDYRLISEGEMEAALRNRAAAGPAERSTYASYVNEHFLSLLEDRYADRLVFQFSLGAEPLPHETGARLRQESIKQLGEMIARHPKLRFQCFNAALHANQALCTLCRELPNLSLAGYWWHNFHPSAMAPIMSQRLDMLPLNKQIGFFSDAYCAEWAYAKSVMVRHVLARVLAEKVALGMYDEEMALLAAQNILLETPRACYTEGHWPLSSGWRGTGARV
jgi:hypothetical protein